MAKRSTVDLDEDNEVEEQSRQCSRWTREEEILICECWIETFKNSDIKVNRNENSFWGHIMQDFNNGIYQGTRTKYMLTGKWSRINGDCQKFNAIYKHLERKSGKNKADHIETANTIFMAQSKRRKFMLEHAARSNVDHTRLISKSIFVSNFSDNTTSKDLWEVCKGYGTVVDVFIPDRKSKAGKRFVFVRFIKVDNVDRLVGKLCTLWIGCMHLHANVARFDRPPIHSSRPNISTRPAANGASSFASVLKGNLDNFNHIASSPAMVLDDECVVDRDLDNFVMGEVNDFSSINNLRVLLSNEGFQHFSQLFKAQPDFVSGEWIVWIDIEGVPLHAWSRPTFSKIGPRWGEVIELEDNKEDCFARKRICIKTKLEDNILEKFKIIVRGKNFVIRAKELFVWFPTFNDNKEVDDYSEDDSDNGAEEKNNDIIFDDKVDSLGHEHTQNLSPNEKENSSDPFNLYNLLNKRDKGEANSGLDSSIPFPPGFTPEREFQHVDAQEVQGMENSLSKRRSEGLSSRVLEDAQPLNEHVSPSIDSKKKQVARYWRSSRWFPMNCLSLNVQGLGSKAKKDWIKELNNKHKVNFLSVQETKLDCISDMDVKVLWGNYKFEYTISEAVGNSGGILCVWDPSVFRKEHHVVSDNFVALYGSWVSNQAKLLVVSIYAPQSITSKRLYIRRLSLVVSIYPTFNDNKEVDDYFEDDSVNGAEEINGDISKQMNLDDESDIEGVSDTVFDDNCNISVFS
ncbi:RNA-directed DNA polymerase, eukaryota, partial [Tanacetum coccineum]